jgi:hypothetical protein
VNGWQLHPLPPVVQVVAPDDGEAEDIRAWPVIRTVVLAAPQAVHGVCVGSPMPAEDLALGVDLAERAGAIEVSGELCRYSISRTSLVLVQPGGQERDQVISHRPILRQSQRRSRDHSLARDL